MKTAIETKTWTWEELVKLEPRLAQLEAEIRLIKPSPGFCASAMWYGNARRPGLKAKMCVLVGWDAKNPVLRGYEAYDTAYAHLYSLLPACQHPGPFC